MSPVPHRPEAPAFQPAPSLTAKLDRRGWAIVVGLVVVTLLAYWRVGDCDFVNVDDDAYVQQQWIVNRGVRPAAVVWAFTAAHSGIWHPLATLSHALDCDLFGVKPGPMHWENLALHMANVLLVFVVWRRLFGGLYSPALVAALFALHPLNVESVAWISERKNVLSTSFWLLAMLAYARYAAAPSVRGYIWTSVWFTLGLMTKPMLVTFPFVLLLLDGWPLERWRERTPRRLVAEKLPLFALAAVVCLITVVAQAHAGATGFGQRFSLLMRVGNAVVSYVRYLGKMVWPAWLSSSYWHPGMWPWPTLGCALAVLVTFSLVMLFQRRRRPWVGFGWLWFLGTLVPVIGLMQSGGQAMADRYAYVPLLGIYTVIALGGAECVARSPRLRTPMIGAAVIALSACFLLTRRQVLTWTDSGTLCRHSIAVGEDNPAVHFFYAAHLAATGRPETEIVAEYRRALEVQPDYVDAMTQLALHALAHGRNDEARSLVERSIRCEPNNPHLRFNFASFLVRTGQIDEAVRAFQQVLQLDSRLVGVHWELGKIYLDRNQFAEALAHFRTRAELDRWNPDAQCDYGILLGKAGRTSEALPYLQKALWLLPDHERARQGIATLRQLTPALP